MPVDDFDWGYGQYVTLDDIDNIDRIDNIDSNGHLVVEKNTDIFSKEKKSTNRDKYTVLINDEAKNITVNSRYDVIEIREENDISQILEFNVKHIIIEMVSLVYQMFKFNLY